jgi:type IV secretion system protein VirB10
MTTDETGSGQAKNPASRQGDDGAAAPPSEAGIVGDRGITPINRSRSLQSRLSNLLAMGLMSTLGLGMLTWYYAQTYSRHAHVRQAAQAASQSRAQGDMPLPPLGRIDPPAALASAAPPAAVEAAALERILGPEPQIPAEAAAGPVNPVLLTPRASGGARPSGAQRSLQRRLAGPVFTDPGQISGSGGGEASPDESARTELTGLPGAVSPVVGTGREGQGNDPGAMAELLRPSVTPAVSASVVPTQDLLLPKGAFIDCTLETAIDSSLPGLTTCITATDTFGADGRVVLLERGTKLVGETRGIVQQGIARVFVLWTEARTPTGVVVPLASPGTDELGRSGLPGAVNRHFFERFGAAMLISVMDGAVQAEGAAHSNGGAVIYNPTSSEDVMTEVLKGTVDIAPTVVKQNGDRIQVLVARDLDFRSVYELRTVSTH